MKGRHILVHLNNSASSLFFVPIFQKLDKVGLPGFFFFDPKIHGMVYF
jgi:hypothetical protein